MTAVFLRTRFYCITALRLFAHTTHTTGLNFFSLVFFRFLEGVGLAASWGAGVSILMELFPDKVSTICSWSETLYGFGYMLGLKISLFDYS